MEIYLPINCVAVSQKKLNVTAKYIDKSLKKDYAINCREGEDSWKN